MTPLEELERLRAECLGMVSHELRTPLTSIKESAVTLMDDSSDLGPADFAEIAPSSTSTRAGHNHPVAMATLDAAGRSEGLPAADLRRPRPPGPPSISTDGVVWWA